MLYSSNVIKQLSNTNYNSLKKHTIKYTRSVFSSNPITSNLQYRYNMAELNSKDPLISSLKPVAYSLSFISILYFIAYMMFRF